MKLIILTLEKKNKRSFIHQISKNILNFIKCQEFIFCKKKIICILFINYEMKNIDNYFFFVQVNNVILLISKNKSIAQLQRNMMSQKKKMKTNQVQQDKLFLKKLNMNKQQEKIPMKMHHFLKTNKFYRNLLRQMNNNNH